MKTKLTELLGIKYPVIQGGMAWTSDAVLAAAVSNAGGAGIIGSGGRTVEWTRDEVRKAKSLTDKPFGVNVMLMAPNIAEIIAMLCEEKVAFVTLVSFRNTTAVPPLCWMPSAIFLTGKKSYRKLSEMSCFIVWTVMARKGFRERAALREQP